MECRRVYEAYKEFGREGLVGECGGGGGEVLVGWGASGGGKHVGGRCHGALEI